MSDWHRVYSTKLSHRAEIVKTILEENGMHSIVLNKQDQLYQIGQYEVHTMAEHVPEATKIIEHDIHFE